MFGLYGTPSDAGEDALGMVVKVSEHFGTDVMTHLRARSLQWLRSADGHPTDLWYAETVMAELARFVDDLDAQLVVIEGIWLHRYVTDLQEHGCRVVLDAHGVESELHEELALAVPHRIARELAARTPRVEEAAFRAVDQIWIPSDREASLTRRRFGAHLAPVVVPNVIELDRYPTGGKRGGSYNVIFPAAFGFLPNVVAARRLLDNIFPALLERVENAHLGLVGRDPTPDMVQAAATSRTVEVTGPVADVIPYLRRASAMAVPLTEGTGTRFKILEAFASRIPLVSTSKGIEGIDAEPGTHYLPAESDAEFVDALTRLARDPALGAGLVAAAFELVRERYSLERVQAIVAHALAAEPVP